MTAFRNTFLKSIPKFIFYQNLRPKSGLKLPIGKIAAHSAYNMFHGIST